MSKTVGVMIGLIGLVIVGLFTGFISLGAMSTLLTFLAVLGVLVYIHEAGHFLTARRNGVTCHEFGFGFPPRIGGIVRDEKTGKRKFIWGNEGYYGTNTLFSINLIPLGGFVRIKGENADPHQKELDPDHFAAQSVWVRFKILVAGVVMNLLLAWVLYTLAAMIGVPAQTHNIAGEPIDIPSAWVAGEPRVLVNNALPDKAAQAMGISIGDAIQKICAAGSCAAIMTEQDVIDAVTRYNGQNVDIEVIRGGETKTFSGPLPVAVEGEHTLGVEIVQMVQVQYPVHIAALEGAKRTGQMTIGILYTLTQLPKILISGADQLSGPIGIAAMTGQARDLGIAFLMNFAAMLSVNLAVFNILPIPALDGGRILFLLIEKIKGSPINPRTEGLLHTIFFTLLILLMIFVSVKDVGRFLPGA